MKIGNKEIKELFLHGYIMGSEYAGGIILDEGNESIDIHFKTKAEIEAVKSMLDQFLNIYRKEEEFNA